MSKLYRCPKYEQSDEKCGSHVLRNSCRKCGRTLEAHLLDQEMRIPSNELAQEWLKRAGYYGKPYFELVRVILTRYIEDMRDDN